MRVRSSIYLSLLASFLASVPANASIIYNFVSVTSSGTNFDWKYSAQLSADQKLAATTSTGAAATDMAIVFDFAGLVSASASNVLSGLTVANFIEATSTQAFMQAVPDSAALSNVRTVITGTVTPSVQTVLYTLDILSTLGGRGNFVFQSGQALKNSPGLPTDGTFTGNTVQIEGPGAVVSTVPEPTTLLMFGSSLIGLGLIGRKRKS